LPMAKDMLARKATSADPEPAPAAPAPAAEPEPVLAATAQNHP
jgi:hypothetical protein